MRKPKINVVIPAFNEEQSIGKVIADIPKEIVSQIIVANNNSSDRTKLVAQAAGAIVVDEERAGYGFACLKGIDYLKQNVTTDILVFLDGDYSDYPEQLADVVEPIVNGQADLVIGSRALGKKESGSMTFPQIFGNWLATTLIKLFYNVRFTDLGPFRAISWNKLMQINMQDQTYGWTVEMQVKAAKHKLRAVEVPVNYKRRIGVSKVSGTIKGTVLAGYKILFTIFKYL